MSQRNRRSAGPGPAERQLQLPPARCRAKRSRGRAPAPQSDAPAADARARGDARSRPEGRDDAPWHARGHDARPHAEDAGPPPAAAGRAAAPILWQTEMIQSETGSAPSASRSLPACTRKRAFDSASLALPASRAILK